METSHNNYLLDCLTAACIALSVSKEEVQGPVRKREFSDARRIYCHMATSAPDYNFILEDVGVVINRSHGQTLRYAAQASDYSRNNKGFARLVNAAQEALQNLNFNNIPQL